MRASHDPAGQLARVVIERHVEELRADLGRLPGRASRARAKQRADIAEDRGSERRPTEQPRAEHADRDRDRELAPHADEGGKRQRHQTAGNLEGARQRGRIGRAEHLQQQIKNDNGDCARNQGWHTANIVALAAKNMPIFRSLLPVLASAPCVEEREKVRWRMPLKFDKCCVHSFAGTTFAETPSRKRLWRTDFLAEQIWSAPWQSMD